ncbi:MAG: hypothetical protein GW947_02640 [Candidatus Pacebacteria bacterium]|nr:hypothetical protein [Candidatus Paceibacterota bacterium]
MTTLWFEQYASDALYNSVIDGFAADEQMVASEKLLMILELAAREILLVETEDEYLAEVAELLSSKDAAEITDWLSNQPLSITDSLRERLDRTILQIQAQLQV